MIAFLIILFFSKQYCFGLNCRLIGSYLQHIKWFQLKWLILESFQGKTSLSNFYGRHLVLIHRYGISVSQMTMNITFCLYHNRVLFSSIVSSQNETYHRVCSCSSNTCEAATDPHSWVHTRFQVGFVLLIFWLFKKCLIGLIVSSTCLTMVLQY